jgi:hypothetical protein
MDKLAQHTDESFRKLTEAQAQTEERMSVLMRTMDGWIKRQAQPGQKLFNICVTPSP